MEIRNESHIFFSGTEAEVESVVVYNYHFVKDSTHFKEDTIVHETHTVNYRVDKKDETQYCVGVWRKKNVKEKLKSTSTLDNSK